MLSSVSRSADSNFSTLLDGMEEDLSVGATVLLPTKTASSGAILEAQRGGTCVS